MANSLSTDARTTPTCRYLPAHMLLDWRLERSGRGGEASSDAERPQGEGVVTAASAGIVIIGDEVLKGKVSFPACCVRVLVYLHIRQNMF